MSSINSIIALPDAVTESILCYLLDVGGNNIGMITTPWDEGSASKLVGKVKKLDTTPGYAWLSPSIVLVTELHALGENAILDTGV